MRFDGKVILITGGTSGIGKETALLFGREGAKVVLSGRRADAGQAVADEIKAAGGTAMFVQADVVQEDDVRNLVEKTVEAHGRIDIAFNNAGVEQLGPITEFSAEDYRHVFDINVLGVFFSLKHELPVMIKQGGGTIINTSSIVGHIGMPGAAVYIASKHAVEGITKTAALEYAEHNIRVNAVAPGAIETDMIDRFAGPEGSEMRDYLVTLHPLGRLGRAPEVAAAVAYLASDEASFTTGTSLPVDGGFMAR